jgi:hypothetical protein
MSESFIKLIDANKIRNFATKRYLECKEAEQLVGNPIHPLSYQYKAYADAMSEVLEFMEGKDIELKVESK